MHDETSFLRAMQEQPGDESVRLVFSDWLEERGDPRGELLRLLNTLTQAIEVNQRRKWECRIRKLLTTGVHPVGPFFTNTVGMKFSLVWPGTFLMGSPPTERGRARDETRHEVTLTNGFFLAIHPVTQGCWRKIVGGFTIAFENSENYHENMPMSWISWEDCQDFLRKLSEQDGRQYRMPTETEWEYACRAGTTTAYHFGPTITKKQVKFDGVRGNVGGFPPNAWGLYDMHGNLAEWCLDWHARYPKGRTVDPLGPSHGEDRVTRGGWWCSEKNEVRSACRGKHLPGWGTGTHGLRPVMIL